MCGSSSDSRSIARWSVESGPVGDVADRTDFVLGVGRPPLGPPTSSCSGVVGVIGRGGDRRPK